MQKPYALIGGHGVGAPHKVIFRHHHAKARLGTVHETICSAQDFLFGFVCIAKHRCMRRLAISGNARKIAPVRHIFRRTILLVRIIARGNGKFRAGKKFFVGRVVAFVRTRRHIGGVCGKVVAHIRRAPAISLLGCIKALGGVIGIKRLVHASCYRHHAGKIKGSLGTLTDNIKFCIVLRRHHIAWESKRG